MHGWDLEAGIVRMLNSNYKSVKIGREFSL